MSATRSALGPARRHDAHAVLPQIDAGSTIRKMRFRTRLKTAFPLFRILRTAFGVIKMRLKGAPFGVSQGLGSLIPLIALLSRLALRLIGEIALFL